MNHAKPHNGERVGRRAFLAASLASVLTARRITNATEPPSSSIPTASPGILQTLDRLEAGASALLPPIRTTGEWNAVTREFNMETFGPQGRDYSNKAVWMPDRNRAFFCGANHGAPHRLNDAWEYDLPSNSWNLLFPPDPTDAVSVMEITDLVVPGQSISQKYVQTKRGGPSHYGHTWWGLVYDPRIRAALWMNVAIGETPLVFMKRAGIRERDTYHGPPLWAFDPAQRSWKLILTSSPYPPVGYGGAMEYLPELGGCVWYLAEWYAQGMWLLDSRSLQWRDLRPNSGESLYHSQATPRADSVFCYDRVNRILVAQAPNRATYHYGVKTNRWEQVLPPGAAPSTAPAGHDAHTVMSYDPHSASCLLFQFQEPGVIWNYTVTSRKWTVQSVSGPACPGSPGRPISYFDEARNAFVVNNAETTWIYRQHRL